MKKFVKRLVPFLLAIGTLLASPFGMHVALAQGPNPSGLPMVLEIPPSLSDGVGGIKSIPWSYGLDEYAKVLEPWVTQLAQGEWGNNYAAFRLKQIQEAIGPYSDGGSALRARMEGLRNIALEIQALRATRLAAALRAARVAQAATEAAQTQAAGAAATTATTDAAGGAALGVFFFPILQNPCAGWENGEPIMPQSCGNMSGWSPWSSNQ